MLLLFSGGIVRCGQRNRLFTWSITSDAGPGRAASARTPTARTSLRGACGKRAALKVPPSPPRAPSRAGDSPPFSSLLSHFAAPAPAGMRRRGEGKRAGPGAREDLPPSPRGAVGAARPRRGSSRGGRCAVSSRWRGVPVRGRGAGEGREPVPGERRGGSAGRGSGHRNPSRSRPPGEAGAGGWERGLRGCQSRLPHAGPYRAQPCSPPAKPPSHRPPKPPQKLPAGLAGAAGSPPGPTGSLRVPPGPGTCTGTFLLPCAAGFCRRSAALG